MLLIISSLIILLVYNICGFFLDFVNLHCCPPPPRLKLLKVREIVAISQIINLFGLACCLYSSDNNVGRSDPSHAIYSDNCLLQADGSCWRDLRAHTEREYR